MSGEIDTTKKFIITLLNDEHGINEDAYNLMFETYAYDDVFSVVTKGNGRVWLEEDIADKLLTLTVSDL